MLFGLELVCLTLLPALALAAALRARRLRRCSRAEAGANLGGMRPLGDRLLRILGTLFGVVCLLAGASLLAAFAVWVWTLVL